MPVSPFTTLGLLGAETIALTSTPTALPNIPTSTVRQLTIRSVDNPWEWQLISTPGVAYFWMAAGDIFVIPIRDNVQLADFQFKAVSITADTRILYES